MREVELCGHATLAAAHVLFEIMGYAEPAIVFETLSGELTVKRRGKFLEMDFPAQAPLACDEPAALLAGLGREPLEVLAATDYLAVFDSEETVRALAPDHAALSRLDRRGVIVTAPGKDVDFVSRFFAPRYGIPEDPVTGSAHCERTPYWAKRLGKTSLVARQVSKRGDELLCQLKGDRVLLCGSAVTVMVATMTLAA